MNLNDLSIRDINNNIIKLENQLQYWVDIKFKAFERTQPQSLDLLKDKTGGGIAENKTDTYLIICEDADYYISNLENEIIRLTKYVENELRRLETYNPLLKKIIELRDEKDMKWEDIANYVHYSVRQCQRIYKKGNKK